MAPLVSSVKHVVAATQFLLRRSTGVSTRECAYCSSDKIRLYPKTKFQLPYKIPASARRFEDQMLRRDNGVCLQCGLEQAFYHFSAEGGRVFSDLGLDVLSTDNEFGVYPPSAAWLARVYQNDYARRIPKWENHLSAHSVNKITRVLHVRCQYGDVLRYVAQKWGAEPWGVGIIHNCTRYVRENYPEIHLLDGELTTPIRMEPETVGRFDLIICSHSLVHSIQVARDIRTLRSLLSENGRVIFTDEISRKLHNPFHLTHPSEQVFVQMLSRLFNRVERIDDCGAKESCITPLTLKRDNPDIIAWNSER